MIVAALWSCLDNVGKVDDPLGSDVVRVLTSHRQTCARQENLPRNFLSAWATAFTLGGYQEATKTPKAFYLQA